MDTSFIVPLVGFFLILIIGGSILGFLKNKVGGTTTKFKYRYLKKDWFMTRTEHEFYNVLVQAVGNDYYIFPQVHLATLLDHKVKGQSWQGALSHIDRKSVDFVLCDKNYISPKLVIELDDKTHERPDRIERDGEVEQILKEAGLPLLRIENHGSFNPMELTGKIRASLG